MQERGIAEAEAAALTLEEACQIAFQEGFAILAPRTHNQSFYVAGW